jgi:hypothetical protein
MEGKQVIESDAPISPVLVAGHVDAAAACPKCYKNETPLHCACGGYIHKQFASEMRAPQLKSPVVLLDYICSRCGDKFALRTYRK